MKICVLLRSQTGHDFSLYKPSTLVRRIERRMAVQQIETMHEFVRYLQQTPSEIEALFRDLLIGVTGFFRDPQVFQALEEKVIPRLFADRGAGDVIRIWVVGCSTGEEAYSIAILLQERMGVLRQDCRVQVFATDIDAHAIATARAGLYPASIAADLSPERLARFFSAETEGGAYRIHKGIRDMIVFSEQDLSERCPLLPARPDLLPQPPHLHGRSAAQEGHSPLPLRAEPRRLPLPRHLRDGRRVRGSLRGGGSLGEAVPAEARSAGYTGEVRSNGSCHPPRRSPASPRVPPAP